MKKRNLLVFALCAATAIGVGAVNTIDAEAKTITCAQDASQVTYGTLTDSQKEMVAKYFNAEYYASQYFDVVQAVGNDREALLKHFCDCGIWEGRHGWPEFDVSAYASAYNLKEAYGKDIAKYYEDYFTVGVAEGRYLTTVELCEANGIKVESLFGEYKFLDMNIYNAASLMGTTDYKAVAQAVAVAAETKEPVIVQVPDPNGGEPTEFVVAAPTISTMDKCKNLTLIGSFTSFDGAYYIFNKTSTGVAITESTDADAPVLYSTDGNDTLGTPPMHIGDITMGRGSRLCTYLSLSDETTPLDEPDMGYVCADAIDIASSEIDERDSVLKRFMGIYAGSLEYEYGNGHTRTHTPYLYEGTQEATSMAIDVKGMSGAAYFAELPEEIFSNDSYLYNVGVDIKEKDGRYVDMTFGVYNEELNYAQLVEYKDIDTEDVSPYWGRGPITLDPITNEPI